MYATSPDKQKRIAKKPYFKAKKEQAKCLLVWCGRRAADLLRKSGIFDTRLATGPVKDFGAENSSPNCFQLLTLLGFKLRLPF